MSLQVWLPLNGDLHNQGLRQNLNIIGTDITFSNNGKIGKCADFNGASSRIYIPNFSIDNQWSYGCWVNTPTSDTRGWELVIILNNSGSDADSQLAFWIHQKENRIESLANTKYTSTIPYTPYYNSWHHFFATYNGTVLTSYIDGTIIKTQTITNEKYTGTNLTIGARCTAVNGSSFSSFFQGSLNDVRIYDHCLSQKEVEEIAKGLVLHYKLDNNGLGNENLVTGSNTNSTSTNNWGASSAVGGNSSTIEQDSTGIYCVKITRDNTAQSSWDYLYYNNLLRNKIKTNTKYTISFDCKPSVDGSISFVGFVNGNATNYMTNSTTTIQGNCKANQWNHMVYQCTTLNSFNDITVSGQLVYFSRSTSLRGTNVTVLFKNIKVEEGTVETPWCPAITDSLYTSLNNNSNIIYDLSGYHNNGIIIGSLKAITPSPKYNCATHIPATSSKIHISNFLTSGFSNSYSFAWWGKRDSNNPMFWGFSDGIRLNGMYLGNLWNTGDGSNNPLYKIGTTTQVSVPSVNVWHHYVMVGNGSKCYVYLDGELWAEAKTYKAISGTSIYINGWDTGTSYCSNNTDMSDFRIYATALTETQIKELYRTSMNINGDNVLPRDLE